jgi:hypothetical protein
VGRWLHPCPPILAAIGGGQRKESAYPTCFPLIYLKQKESPVGKASRNKSQHFRVAPSKGLLPMSGALIELVEPLRRDDLTLEEFQVLITLAAFAWNLSLFPKAARKTQMQNFFTAEQSFPISFHEIMALGSDEEVKEEPRADMNLIQLIKALTHRKERIFPDDWRFVEKADVGWKNDKFHVTAGSQLYRPPAESTEA